MTVYIALLRSINVAGKNKIKMDALRALLGAQGADDTQTYIQSGNVVFRHANNDADALAHQITEAIAGTLGLDVPVIIRTHEAWQSVLHLPLFTPEQLQTPKFAHVIFCQQTPEDARMQTFLETHQASDNAETVTIHGREVYIFYTNGAGRTHYDLAYVEKKLGVVGTARNWNTVLKIHDMVQTLA